MTNQSNLEKEVSLKVNFNFPDDLRSYFSDNFTVQHQKDHFILSFFEVLQPVILGTEDEKISQIKELKAVDAKCVARVIVTPEKLNDIIKVLNENYNNFKQRKKQKD